MVFTLTSTDPTLAGIDFIKYVKDKPVISRGLNEPSTLDFTLARWGSGFVLPRRGSYFQLGITGNPTYFTGFCTEAPELEFEGKRPSDDQAIWSWQFKLTSDEYILNLAPLGILPVYINQTQGNIIKDLANRIAPGKFTVTDVDDGQMVPYYLVDPTKTFSEIVKEFCEAAYFRFWANDFTLFYERQDTTPAALLINGRSNSTQRVRIVSSTNSTPITVNTDAAHGLTAGDAISIYGHKVNTAANGNWIVASAGGTSLTLTGSIGNGVGGATGWAGLHNPHFTPSQLQVGPVIEPVVNDVIVIGDVEPQGIMNEYRVGDGLTNDYPLLSSIFGVDSALLFDDIFTGTDVDPNKYTVVDSINNVIRVSNGYLQIIGNAADNFGVYLFTTALMPLQGHLRMTHGEFDFVNFTNNGVIASLWTQTPNSGLTGCVYGLRVTSTGSAINLSPIVNGVVDSTQVYVAESAATFKRYIIRTMVVFRKIYRTTRQFLFRQITGTLGSYGGDQESDRPNYLTIITEIDATTGKPTDNQMVLINEGASTGLASSQFFATYSPAVSNNMNITVSNITISVPMQAALRMIERDVWYPEFNRFRLSDGMPAFPDESNLLTVQWTPRIVGPNEIDSYDGMSPTATIVTSRQGRIDSGNILGSTLYNAGDASLRFFADSIKQTANTPKPGELLHLRYRRAGIAIGRAQNTQSITDEAAVWGDSGLRTVTKKDLKPLPRTALECEMAAAAMVEEHAYQHYAGTYTQWAHYEFSGVPMPGTIMQFKNLPSTFPAVQAELITAVKTTLENNENEYFKHEVTFGKIDKVKQFLSGIKNPSNPYAPTDTAATPSAADLDSILQVTSALSLIFHPIFLTLTYGGTSSFLPSTALDIDLELRLKGWTGQTYPDIDGNYLIIDIGQGPPAGGGFEIRYSDQGWGDENNKNFLVYDTITNGQTTAQEFKIARQRDVTCFVKAFDADGKYSRYASGIKVVFPEIPRPIQGFKSAGGTLTHPRFKAILPTVDNQEDGISILSGDIFGMRAYFVHEQEPTGWFLRNGATYGSTYVASAGDNPGEWETDETTNPTGLLYTVATVSLPVTGSDLVTQHGYINMIPINAEAEQIEQSRNEEAVFFVWAKADVANTIIRLNLKDDLVSSPQPFGFYSRHDHVLADTGTWYRLATKAKMPETITGTPHYNIVIHNVGPASANVKIAIPLLGVGIANNQDIAMGLSPDNPYLEFQYNNEGTEE